MIPQLVNVAGIEFDIKDVEGIHDRFDVLGQINYVQGSIELDISMCKSKKQQTLVHEILHACFNEAGYNDHEEEVINRVGIVLYQVLKQNKLCFGE